MLLIKYEGEDGSLKRVKRWKEGRLLELRGE